MSELGAIMDQNARLVDEMEELSCAVGTLALCVAMLGGAVIIIVWKMRGNQ